MLPQPNPRAPHPCVSRRCGHSPAHHLATPELAGRGEVVVWCVACRRHESRRQRRSWIAPNSPLRLRHALSPRPF
ncbi:MAG: hypothetical protein ACLP74_02830 [Thermoplasmata archaeon]